MSDLSDDESISDWREDICRPHDDSNELRDLLQHLRSLDCSRSSMVNQCCKILEPKAELVLKDLQGEDAEILGDALKLNATVNCLVLGNLQQMFLPIAEAISSNQSIVKLDPSFDGGMTKDECVEAANALMTNQSVTNLVLCANTLEKEGAMAIAFYLKTNNTRVTNINLGFCSLGNDGCIALANALKTNKTITNINLTYNGIEKEGGMAIADVLQTNNTLKRLFLAQNPIGQEGGIAIASALYTNTTLFELDMEQTDCGPEAAFDFAGALVSNKTITKLSLRSNNIDEDGGEALMSILQTHNTTLTDLNIFFSMTDKNEDERNRIRYFGDKLLYYLALNKAGRKIMLNEKATTGKQVETLIQNRHKIDMIRDFLLLKPDLCEQQGSKDDSVSEGSENPKRKKRKRYHAHSTSTTTSAKF